MKRLFLVAGTILLLAVACNSNSPTVMQPAISPQAQTSPAAAVKTLSAIANSPAGEGQLSDKEKKLALQNFKFSGLTCVYKQDSPGLTFSYPIEWAGSFINRENAMTCPADGGIGFGWVFVGPTTLAQIEQYESDGGPYEGESSDNFKSFRSKYNELPVGSNCSFNGYTCQVVLSTYGVKMLEVYKPGRYDSKDYIIFRGDYEFDLTFDLFNFTYDLGVEKTIEDPGQAIIRRTAPQAFLQQVDQFDKMAKTVAIIN